MINAIFVILAIIFGWIILNRIIRHFFNFPIPAVFVSLIDNPLRRLIQPPTRIVRWMDIKGSMNILEIGPGLGTFTIEAAKQTCAEGILIAIDIQPVIVSKLNKRFEKEEITNAETIASSADNIPLISNVFHRVFMVAVMGELPDKRKALLEVRRVLRDDGLLSIGELLPDPDYPRRKNVINWCHDAGFKLAKDNKGILHYFLTFKKLEHFW